MRFSRGGFLWSRRVIDYLRKNTSGVTLIGVAVVIVAAMGLLKGCSIDEMIPVSVPAGVQSTTGADARVSLAEAPGVLAKHNAIVSTDGQSFAANIEDAAWFSGLAKSFVGPVTDTAQITVAGLPGGAIFSALIAGAGGLLLDKPGAKKKTQAAMKEAAEAEARVWKEKIESYNKAAKS